MMWWRKYNIRVSTFRTPEDETSLLRLGLAGKVKQSVASVRPSICLSDCFHYIFPVSFELTDL